MCVCQRTSSPSRTKFTNSGRSPSAVAGMWSRSTGMRASAAPRGETSGLASTPCSRSQPAQIRHRHGLGNRPPRPVADRPARHDRASQEAGVDLYLDQQNIDTTTPMGKLLFQMTGAFAEFERSMIRQRVRAGLSVIKAKLASDGNCQSRQRAQAARPARYRAREDRARTPSSARSLASSA